MSMKKEKPLILLSNDDGVNAKGLNELIRALRGLGEIIVIEPDAPEGGKSMSEIRVKENESLESALKRFKRSCAKAGVIAEVKKREHYVSPSLKRKQKSEAARKNRKKFY